jgi:NTP pyrophosphatase (non-canonical NTP hydrolase)
VRPNVVQPSGHRNAKEPPSRGVVVLVTSPRVAPGLLTLPAWDTLRSAAAVVAGAESHAQLAALDQAGIGWEVAPAEPAAGRARRLSRMAEAAATPVVWLAAPDGDEELIAALTACAAPPTVLLGCDDLPGSRLLDLVTTMDVLRTRCPWDAKQTHRSLAPHLIEESYEALEALESADAHALRDELGDVLLQVVFHARIAAERGDGTGFTIDDVAGAIVSKLVRRHPHVFGDVEVSGADEVKTNWAAIKAAEREAEQGGPVSVLDGIPFGQPALSLAAQIQGRAAGAGVPAGFTDLGDDLGARLFALVTEARAAGLDPELELRAASRRFRDKVHRWEKSGAANAERDEDLGEDLSEDNT